MIIASSTFFLVTDFLNKEEGDICTVQWEEPKKPKLHKIHTIEEKTTAPMKILATIL